jgi:enamine deaminase RidA (YjgF/YER057c/UK114 family)
MLRSSSYYSQAVAAGPYLFLAGQMPVETGTGRFIRGYADIPEEGRFLATGRSHSDTRNGPIAAQTWFEYDHVRRVLEALGASMGDVLNLTVYLQDLRDLPTFYRVHQRFFPAEGPAMTVTEFAEVGHGGTLVEIEVTALLPGRGLPRRALAPPRLARGTAHRSPAVAGGPLLFVSGQVAWMGERPVTGVADLPPEGCQTVESMGSGRPQELAVAAQTWQIFANLKEILAEAGLGFRDLVKTTVYLTDLEDFPAYDRVRAAWAPEEPPALTLVQVPKVGAWEGCRVCVEAIAWCG